MAAIVLLLAGFSVVLVTLAQPRVMYLAHATSSLPAIAPSSMAAPAPVDVFTVRDWMNSGGADHLSHINDDLLAFNSGGLAGSARDARLRAQCAALQQDAQAAKAYRSIPDAEAQQAWGAVLDYFDRGGTDCVAAVDQHDGDLLGKASDEFEQGGIHFHKVIDRLTALAPK